jgi:hypothetical protein
MVRSDLSYVLHFEKMPGKAACGRKLPTAGYFTDALEEFEEREGSRCKTCWRVVSGGVPEFDLSPDRKGL